MPKVKANGITLNYEQQGSGDPLILIPYLSAETLVTRFKSPSTPNTSLASPSIYVAAVKATNLKVKPLPSCMPTISRR